MKTKIATNDIFKIVGDGAIATHNTADGRLLTVLMVKSTNNNGLDSLIKIHGDTLPGDVQSMWAKKRFNSKTLFLVLKFKKPLEIEVIIEFYLSEHYVLVDAIMQSRGVYLQLGNKGDLVSDNVNAPKILVEIPTGTTYDNWDKMFTSIIVKRLRNKGFSRRAAASASIEHIERHRELWGTRFKPPVE